MNKQTSSDEITLKELVTKTKEWFAYLLSKWMIILTCGLVGAALGLANAYFKKPLYTAALSFALEDQQSGNITSALGLASQLGFDLGGGGGGIFAGANLIELFKSRTMVEQTLLKPVTVNGTTMSFAEMYICTTSSPATAPVFFTETDSFKESPAFSWFVAFSWSY